MHAQLARLLASSAFDASERNRRFLGYVVEETLAGRSQRIKAYDVAVTVFGRDDSFDPQADPIVRIEASRLRRSLERYYLLAGQADPIRIEIPKGGYVPVFRPQAGGEATSAAGGSVSAGSAAAAPAREADDPLPARREAARAGGVALWRGWPRARLASLLVLVGIGGFVAAFVGWQVWMDRDQPFASAPVESRPSLMVVPFDDLGSGPGDHFAEGVAQEVISSLIRFKEFVVFDARTSFQAAQADPLEFGRRAGADYLVTGTVRRDGGRVRVNAQLVNLATGTSIWAASYDEQLAVDRLFEIQAGIAAHVAATVAQPYGVVHRDARDQLQRDPPDSLGAYECLLQAYAYRRRIARAPHAAVRGCLEEAVLREPAYSDALAMLAMIYVDEYRFRFNPRPDRYDPLGRALDVARRAVELAPESGSAHMALFETLFLRGELEKAFAAGERAVALNPNNPEPRAMLGLRLAHAGAWERGTALVQEALATNPSPPGWYYFPLSMDAFRRGDDDAALVWAEKIDQPGLYWTHVVLAAIYGQLGRKDEAARAVERLLEINPSFEERPLIELGRHHFEPAVLRRLVDGLRKAGLQIPEPTASAEQLR